MRLHDLRHAFCSRIRVMRELMREHGLMPPTFESSRDPDSFKAYLLLHNLLEEQDLAWSKTLTPEELSHEDILALVFVREVGAIDNSSFRNISGLETLAASARLRRLRDLHLLEKRGGGSKTHYVPGTQFTPLEPVAAPDATGGHPGSPDGPDPHHLGPDPHHSGPDPHHLPQDPHHPPAGPGGPPPDLEALREALPEDLQRQLPEAGSRPRRPQLRQLITALCSWRPLGSEEIAELLGGRDKKTLVREHLSPMLEEGILAYTIPHMVNHPDQKYTTKPSEEVQSLLSQPELESHFWGSADFVRLERGTPIEEGIDRGKAALTEFFERAKNRQTVHAES